MFGLKTKVDKAIEQHTIALLDEYVKAKSVAAAAEARAKAARAALAAVPGGTYGRWVLSWSPGRRVVDQGRVREILGDDTPYTTTAEVINVKRVEE